MNKKPSRLSKVNGKCGCGPRPMKKGGEEREVNVNKRDLNLEIIGRNGKSREEKIKELKGAGYKDQKTWEIGS